MASLHFPLLSHVYRTAIPYAVALAGALLTVWLAREVELDDLARRDHRFQREAQEQAESITRPFTEHLSTLEIVQRMLHTVAPLDEATLTRILDPLSHGTGLRGFAWAPRVAAAEQAEFERRGKARWGRSFAITALDAQRRLGRAPPRERWFPVEFGTLSDPRRSVVGLDLESLPELRPLIEEAIEEGTPLSSGYIPAALEPFSDRKMVALLVPVYATERIPLHREERRKAIRGLLVATLDIVDLFDVALAFGHGELHVGLFDFSRPEQAVRRWPPTDVDDAPAEPPDFPKYSRVFELAGHLWNVRVEADAAWLAANTNNRAHYVAAAGLLLSLLAFFTLRRLLGRSALAERLERSHGDVLNRQRAAENRASMLAMVVEQSPAAIMIANLRGRIEYVNDMFIEMTGYARDEAIGKPATLLDASGESDGAYREMHEAILANRTWRGELPGRRRDGRIFWERAIVAPIRDPDGDTTHVMAIGEDITELRGLMARLQESENRFRGAMTVMAEGLAVLSRDGVCYFANRAAAAILRHPERGLQRLEARRLPVQFLDPDGDAMPSPLENGRLMAALCARRELRNRVVGLRFRDGAVGQDQVVVELNRVGLLRLAPHQHAPGEHGPACAVEHALVGDAAGAVVGGVRHVQVVVHQPGAAVKVKAVQVGFGARLAQQRADLAAHNLTAQRDAEGVDAAVAALARFGGAQAPPGRAGVDDLAAGQRGAVANDDLLDHVVKMVLAGAQGGAGDGHRGAGHVFQHNQATVVRGHVCVALRGNAQEVHGPVEFHAPGHVQIGAVLQERGVQRGEGASVAQAGAQVRAHDLLFGSGGRPRETSRHGALRQRDGVGEGLVEEPVHKDQVDPSVEPVRRHVEAGQRVARHACQRVVGRLDEGGQVRFAPLLHLCVWIGGLRELRGAGGAELLEPRGRGEFVEPPHRAQVMLPGGVKGRCCCRCGRHCCSSHAGTPASSLIQS